MNNEKEIYYAIVYNEPGELEKLITKENINSKIKDGYPVHYAVIKNNYDITKYLLENGADGNMQFEDGATPLIIASENGFSEICRLLLEHKVQVNEVDKHGNDALVKAILYGRTDIIKLLLKHGANPNNSKVKGKTAIQLAEEMKQEEMIVLLKKSHNRQ